MTKLLFSIAILTALFLADAADASFYIPPGSITADKLAFGVNQPTGSVEAYTGRAAPSGWFMAYGQSVSRTTYASLYAIMCPQLGTFTVTIASPAVITLTGHGLSPGDRIRLFTTGALPTGLSSNSDIYVLTVLGPNTFTVSATQGGAVINTTGAQSGVHTAQFFGYGAGDGTTTFDLPDMRGRLAAGNDQMGGTAASRLTTAFSLIFGGAIGSAGGDERMQAHLHTVPWGAAQNGSGGGSNLWQGNNAGTPRSTNITGAGNSQNVQPTMIVNYIIKY